MNITSREKSRKGIKERLLDQNMQRNVLGWLIFLPTILLTFLGYRDIYIGIKLSFFQTKGFIAEEFVGLRNYFDVVSDSLFKTALINICEYEFWSILAGIIPFVMAICLNEVFKGKAFFRFSMYLPVIVPGLITSLLFNILLDPGDAGLLNMMLGKIGLGPYGWLQDPDLVIPSIIATSAWKFGGTMIYYLAALQSVSNDLYEAVEIDGGRFWSKFRHITMPHLLPMVGVMLILNILGTFQIFDQALAMTGGGPNYASLTLGLLTYNYAFSYLQVGRAGATSVIMSLIITPISILYFMLTNKKGK